MDTMVNTNAVYTNIHMSNSANMQSKALIPQLGLFPNRTAARLIGLNAMFR
jgi:hypothetical protein